eukprot:10019783-Karenia_brevis.AAC.1
MEVDSKTTEEKVDMSLSSIMQGSREARERSRPRPRSNSAFPQSKYSVDEVLKGCQMNEEGRRRLKQTCIDYEASIQTAQIGQRI